MSYSERSALVAIRGWLWRVSAMMPYRLSSPASTIWGTRCVAPDSPRPTDFGSSSAVSIIRMDETVALVHNRPHRVVDGKAGRIRGNLVPVQVGLEQQLQLLRLRAEEGRSCFVSAMSSPPALLPTPPTVDGCEGGGGGGGGGGDSMPRSSTLKSSKQIEDSST
uniref:Uncharacterized protein n=1 Tax=Anopheles coluzzii TaxID=1518534 RepID=A0A8W7P0Q5_ANOCL